MEAALNLNQPIIDTSKLAKLKTSRKNAISEMKKKVNSAELALVIEKLKESGIEVTNEYKDIQELLKHLKKTLPELDYNKAETIVNTIDKEFDKLITTLENGSTNAFTRFMTSDLSTSIAKSLGISLTGGVLLTLAPTLGTKALVGAGLGTYYLVNSIKNRKEIKATNANNELNNILLDLESTKVEDKLTDTRFSEEIQKEIRQFLKNNNVYYEDTGYRSLRTVIYNLDYDKKLSLANLINARTGKGLEIETRIKKAKKSFNVVSSTINTTAQGLSLGVAAANTVNSINPALLAAPTNTIAGSFLGSWLAKISQKSWMKELTVILSGAVSLLSFLPGVVGKFANKIFSAENLAVCSALGITGGILTSTALGIISTIKGIKMSKKNKKILEEFQNIDNEKYAKDDEKEFTLIKEKIKENVTPEAIAIDLVICYLRDNNIVINQKVTSIAELTEIIKKLPKQEKKEARKILNNIDKALKSNSELLKRNLEKIKTYTIALTLSGFSALSLYDILKDGKILPELSQKLFPKNNIHTPVEQAYSIEALERIGITKEQQEIMGEKMYNDLSSQEVTTDVYTANVDHIFNDDSKEKMGLPGKTIVSIFSGAQYKQKADLYRQSQIQSIIDEPTKTYIPQKVLSSYLKERTPEEIMALKNYIERTPNLNLKHVTDIENKINNIIRDAKKLQPKYDRINAATKFIKNAIPPVAVADETISTLKKNNNSNEKYADEITSSKRKR